MDNGIALANISDVQFGTLGMIDIFGKNFQEGDVKVSIRILDVITLVPRLMQAATSATWGDPEYPSAGTAVPLCFVPVSAAHAFAAKDTKEPCLTLHTLGGMLQFHFPSDVGAECGKELHAIALAASAPEISSMN